jgi:hypothetical protein
MVLEDTLVAPKVVGCGRHIPFVPLSNFPMRRQVKTYTFHPP